MNSVIFGGTSGLGLEIGKLLAKEGSNIIVTGRHPKQVPKEFTFYKLDISNDSTKLSEDLDKLVTTLPTIDLVVYAAGFFENAHIAELSDDHIFQMINVGLSAPALILQRIIKKQETLKGLITVTSTSQWTPRKTEPIYAATKAALAMLSQSISLDERVCKTLVAGPSGMDTGFWSKTNRNTEGLLSPSLVAHQILDIWKDDFVYRLVRILRDPVPEAERIQILDTR